MTDLARIVDAINAARFTAASESELQRGLGEVFAPMGGRAEVRLDGHGTIDFVVDRIGIEVKVHGSISQVTRQVLRYVASDELDAVVLVTTRGAHLPLAHAFHEAGKPVEVVLLRGGIL